MEEQTKISDLIKRITKFFAQLLGIGEFVQDLKCHVHHFKHIVT
jgi:hypothetical protein